MFLGLDLGTSGLRAVLATDGGTIIASSENGYPVAHAHAGWSEQEPANWITALNRCVDELRFAHPTEFAALKGVGVSGHMHGATCLDDTGAVIRPCILWNDTRSHAEAAALDGTDKVRDLSGNIVFPGFTAPKLVWMQTHEPENFARVAKVLLPAAYLNFYMTGSYFADMSDSAGTSWLDVGARDWSDTLLAASGMRRDQMPDLVEGSEVGGTLRDDLAANWGVSSDVVVVGGGGDNAVAACGVGTLAEGDGFVSLGTSGVLLAAKNSFAPKPASAVHTFCHAIPGTWYQMGVILAATDSLNWLSKNLGQKPAELSGLLGDTINGPGAIRFLPYLSGERTPHNDSAIRGAFIGLDIGAGHGELTQAVMEGVSFALRDNLAALESTGTKLDRVLAIGGGSQSPYWVELLATLLNIQIDLPEDGDFGAALGAARLAICGATGAAPSDIMAPPAVAKTISPRAELVAAYQDAWEKYRASYSAIKAIQ